MDYSVPLNCESNVQWEVLLDLSMSQPYVCFYGLELYFYNCNTKFIDKLDNASNLD